MGFFSSVFGKKFGGGLDSFANKTLVNPLESIITNTTNNINKVHDTATNVIVKTGDAINKVTDSGANLVKDGADSAGDIMKQLSKIMPYAAIGFGAIVFLQVLPTILPRKNV